jgi:hypothetical protein
MQVRLVGWCATCAEWMVRLDGGAHYALRASSWIGWSRHTLDEPVILRRLTADEIAVVPNHVISDVCRVDDPDGQDDPDDA